ncbi:LOW QUALITY PROTEIN: sodium/potassium/calcium exchanger 2-like [Anableps anableps]
MESTKSRSQQLILVMVFSGVFLVTFHNRIVGAELTSPLPDIREDFGKITDHSMEEFTGKHSTYSTPYIETPKSKSSFLGPIKHPALHPSPETSTFNPSSCARRVDMIYPSDLFSFEDRRRGWVALHVFGIIYISVSVLIVCDQFFVPSLGVIMETLAISDDVVGTTFMAAGTSIPWFILKLINTLSDHNNLTVNINPAIGSAAFRMLFVIGTCALFSGKVLPLSCWPLFRDLSFYIFGFILLIIFFLDNVVTWEENVILVTFFILYVIFLKYNEKAEQMLKTQLQKTKKLYIPAVEDGAQRPEDCDEEGGNENNGSCNEKRFVESKLLEGAQPLSLRWPDTWLEQAAYIILLPIILILWLTLPNVHSQKTRKFFVLTYLVSIVWIGVFSYLVMWWAHQVKCC